MVQQIKKKTEGFPINRKNLWLLSLLAILTFALAACGSSKKTNKSGSEASDIAFKVNSGEYVTITKYDETDEKTYLKLNVTVQNKSKNEIPVNSSNFSLYGSKDDEKIDSVYVNPPDEESFKELSGSISPEKKASGDLFYPVNKEEKYELHYQPRIYDDKGEKHKELVVSVDPSKYKNDSENAKKAVAAYVDQVFLSNDNPDFKSLLTNDVLADSQKFDEELANQLKEGFGEFTPSMRLEKMFIEKYRNALNKKIEPTYKIAYGDSKQAKVNVSFKNFDTSDLYKQSRKVSEQFAKKNQNKYSYKEYKKAQEDALNYTFSRIDQIMNNTSLKDDSREYALILKETDGKWTIQKTDQDMNSEYDDLLKAFVLQTY